MSSGVSELSQQIQNLLILRNTSQETAIKALALTLVEEAEYPENGWGFKDTMEKFRKEVNSLIKERGLQNAK